VEPSRLLYGIDREAYIEVLKNAGLDAAEVGEEVEEVEAEVLEASKPVVAPWSAPEAGPRVVLLPRYSGALDSHRGGLGAFLEAERTAPDHGDAEGNRLIESLLATAEVNAGLDWTERAPIQARLRVACKRALVHFGIDVGKAAEVAGRLVVWLRVQVRSSELAAAAPPSVAGEASS
jgi:hypothetical protein